MTPAVGESIPRVDGVDKVSGRAVYAGDITLPGMLHGAVLRSPLPHARIVRIDFRRAQAVPGVAVVLTAETLGAVSPYLGTSIKDQPILAIEKVRYAGDVVAAVAGTGVRAVAEALSQIDVEYEELPAVLSVDEALRPGAPLVHEASAAQRAQAFGPGAVTIAHERSNICHHFQYQHGNVSQGFASADLVVEETFDFPSAHHCALEPHTSVADYADGTLTVWTAAQSPFAVRQELARIFGMPEERVRVIAPYVGGGFGGQKSRANSVIAAALSRAAGQPVRVAFRMDECFKTICQPRMHVTIKTGVMRDGTFVARQCRVYLNSGAYSGNSPSVTNKAGYRAHGPYRIPNVLTDAYDVYTNTVPAGSFRGFGAPQVAFAYESHLDDIARRLNMDAVELRMKNLLERGEEYAPGDTPLDCDIKAGLSQLKDAIGWPDGKPAVVRNGRRRGLGIACTMKDAGGTGKTAEAAVRIFRDGTVQVASASVEVGQGVRTSLRQMVSAELGIPTDRISAAESDTAVTPFDVGTHSTSATTIMGRAVVEAARDARNQLLDLAGSVLNADRSTLAIEKGSIVGGTRSLTIAEVMTVASGSEIVGKGRFGLPRTPTAPLLHPSPFWEIGLGAAEVEVDEDTGEVRLIKYVSMTDAGTMIHPLQCRGQDEGSVLFGIGQTFAEELIYRDGRLANGNFSDYRVPRFEDLPEVLETRILEHHGGPGPYGAKGIGEAALLAVAPAVCNAVFNLTDVRFSEVPLTPERVWKALSSLVTLLIVLVLTACRAAPDTVRQADSWSEVVAAADREKRLVIAGPPGTQWRDATMKFGNDHPGIEIEFMGAVGRDHAARMLAEQRAGQFQWDVLIAGAATGIGLKTEALDPLTSALRNPGSGADSAWLRGFADGWADKEQQSVYCFLGESSPEVYVNRDVIPEALLSRVESLTDPAWRGKISWSDPRSPGGGSLQAANLLYLLGEDFLRTLFKQDIAVTGDLRQQLDWIVRGRYPIAMSLDYRFLAEYQQQGLGEHVVPLAAETPAGGGQRLSPGFGCVMLPKNAPHPNAARVFIDWLLSQKGGDAFVRETGVNSRRLDVAAGRTIAQPKPGVEYYNLNKEEALHYNEKAIAIAKELLK